MSNRTTNEEVSSFDERPSDDERAMWRSHEQIQRDHADGDKLTEYQRKVGISGVEQARAMLQRCGR